MERRKPDKKVIRLLIELLLLVVMLGAVLHLHNGRAARNAGADQGNTVGTALENAAEAVSEAAPHKPLATLFFASDYQKEDGWGDPETNLRGIVDAVIASGKVPTGVIMCGDYSNVSGKSSYQISPENSIAKIREIIEEKMPSVSPESTIFIQGNHDHLTDSISESGLHEYDSYLVYVVNTQNDYPWKQGKTAGSLAKVRETAEEMKTCFDDLISKGEKRPVIVALHVPLHYTARTSSKHDTGDNLYASLLFDVINDAGKSLNILCLYGHNHSKGWDCYMGGSSVFRAAGDRLIVPKFTENAVNTDEYTEETLNFTYLNAGYTGYYMNCSPKELANGTKEKYDAGDMALTGTVCEIYPDRMVLTRYDAEGVHDIGSEGCADPYKGYIDRGLIPEEEYGERQESPVEVEMK